METRQYQYIVKKVCMVLPFYFFTFLPLSAQTTYTQRIQESRQGEGTVTIHQDAAIDALVNGPLSTKPAPRPTPVAPQPVKPAVKPVQDVDTTATTGRPYKTTGFRVQVFAGGNTRSDRVKAEQTGHSLEQLFPNDAVYVHFYSPRWICRIGNYRTYEEARAKMMEIRQLGYTSATIVKGKIIVTQ